MGLRPTRRDADATGRFRRTNDLDCVFNGVPMGLWPSHRDEDAVGRSRSIRNLECVFNGADAQVLLTRCLEMLPADRASQLNPTEALRYQ